MSKQFTKIESDFINQCFQTQRESFRLIEAFIWLKNKATWKPEEIIYKNKKIELKANQVLVSLSDLASSWNCSKNIASRMLLKLEKSGLVKKYNHTFGTIITLIV